MAKWKRKRKQAVLEMKEYNYFIFCEGEQTEPNYFKGFESNIENNPIYKDMVAVKVQGCGKETLRVVEDAQDFVQKNKIKNAKVFCVFDKDDFPAKDFTSVTATGKTTCPWCRMWACSPPLTRWHWTWPVPTR